MNGREATVTSSIGIALYPEHGPMAALIANAEAAMCSAKSGGGDGYALYEPRMTSGARDQLSCCATCAAPERRPAAPLYQPKIHAPSGEITGVEALMRWQHPTRGPVGPDEFIPIAERFGLISALGNWVIDEACRQIAPGDAGLPIRVAINLSVHQLRQPDLAERSTGARAQRHRAAAAHVRDHRVGRDGGRRRDRMFERLASSASTSRSTTSAPATRAWPTCASCARQLKIDQSFVLDLETSPDALAVVDAIVKLAHALGLKVVAEGVETEAQHQILRSFGCHELQGFLFARPMSARALALWAMEDVGPGALEFRDSLYRPTAAGALH